MGEEAPVVPGKSERLPWIEPYREPAAKAGTAVRSPKSSRKPVADGFYYSLAAVTGLFAALGAGYLLGERHVLSPEVEQPSDSAIAQVPPAKDDPEIIAANAQIEELEEPESDAPVAEVEEPNAPAAKQAERKPKPRATPKRRLQPKMSQAERVRAKQAEAARTWPKMPSPGPAGQVIQLGAFSSQSKADSTYRRRATRYPLLATMPKVVVPVITQPEGQVLYVLRLGTASREQSEIVCRNLQASGDHCLVIG